MIRSLPLLLTSDSPVLHLNNGRAEADTLKSGLQLLINGSDRRLKHARLSRKYVVKQLAARLRPQLEATVKQNESAPGDSFVPGEFDQVLHIFLMGTAYIALCWEIAGTFPCQICTKCHPGS